MFVSGWWLPTTFLCDWWTLHSLYSSNSSVTEVHQWVYFLPKIESRGMHVFNCRPTQTLCTGGSSQVLNLRIVAKLLCNFVFFLLCKYNIIIIYHHIVSAHIIHVPHSSKLSAPLVLLLNFNKNYQGKCLYVLAKVVTCMCMGVECMCSLNHE